MGTPSAHPVDGTAARVARSQTFSRNLARPEDCDRIGGSGQATGSPALSALALVGIAGIGLLVGYDLHISYRSGNITIE